MKESGPKDRALVDININVEGYFKIAVQHEFQETIKKKVRLNQIFGQRNQSS